MAAAQPPDGAATRLESAHPGRLAGGRAIGRSALRPLRPGGADIGRRRQGSSRPRVSGALRDREPSAAVHVIVPSPSGFRITVDRLESTAWMPPSLTVASNTPPPNPDEERYMRRSRPDPPSTGATRTTVSASRAHRGPSNAPTGAGN